MTPTPVLQLYVERDWASFATLGPRLSAFLDRHEVPAEAAYAVKLVLEELVSNIIRHGQASSNLINVRLSIETERVCVCLEDRGSYFDPRDVPAPELDKPLAERQTGGMGIFLVRSMVDDLRHERIGEINRVTACIGIP